MQSPEPRVGLQFIDPALPQAVWVVVQCDEALTHTAIYVKRVYDGRLYHYRREAWRRNFEHDYLRVIEP